MKRLDGAWLGVSVVVAIELLGLGFVKFAQLGPNTWSLFDFLFAMVLAAQMGATLLAKAEAEKEDI